MFPNELELKHISSKDELQFRIWYKFFKYRWSKSEMKDFANLSLLTNLMSKIHGWWLCPVQTSEVRNHQIWRDNTNDNNKNQEALTDLFVPPWSSSTITLNTFYASRIKLVAHVKIIKICLLVCKPKLPWLFISVDLSHCRF